MPLDFWYMNRSAHRKIVHPAPRKSEKRKKSFSLYYKVKLERLFEKICVEKICVEDAFVLGLCRGLSTGLSTGGDKLWITLAVLVDNLSGQIEGICLTLKDRSRVVSVGSAFIYIYCP